MLTTYVPWVFMSWPGDSLNVGLVIPALVNKFALHNQNTNWQPTG